MSPQEKTPKDLLKEVYLGRKAKNRYYSLRAYARDLKVSQTLISLILSGKRTLTLKTAKRMSSLLMLSKEEEGELLDLTLETKRKLREERRKERAQRALSH